MIENGSPLQDFVTQTLTQIQNSTGSAFTLGNNKIEFELNTISKLDAEGKVRIFVASVGADASIEQIQKVKFQINAKGSADIENEVLMKELEKNPKLVLAKYAQK